jgi:hypothetical protein
MFEGRPVVFYGDRSGRPKTIFTLRELAANFGLGHADSVRNLTRRIDRALLESHKVQQAVAAIRHELSN